MKNTVKFIIGIVFLALLGCGNDESESFIIDEYPLEIGNYWIYNHSFTFHNYNGSIDTISTDTFKISIDDTIVVEGQLYYQFVAESSYPGSQESYRSYQYYFMENQFMKYQFYKMVGSHVSAFFRTASLDSYRILGANQIQEDSLFVEDKPIVSLKFPLRVGTGWTYRDDGQFKINKKVVGMSHINLEAGTFQCLEIDYQFIMKAYSNEATSKEYFSSIGLVKKTEIISNLDDYNNGTEKGDGVTVLELIDYEVK